MNTVYYQEFVTLFIDRNSFSSGRIWTHNLKSILLDPYVDRNSSLSVQGSNTCLKRIFPDFLNILYICRTVIDEQTLYFFVWQLFGVGKTYWRNELKFDCQQKNIMDFVIFGVTFALLIGAEGKFYTTLYHNQFVWYAPLYRVNLKKMIRS